MKCSNESHRHTRYKSQYKVRHDFRKYLLKRRTSFWVLDVSRKSCVDLLEVDVIFSTMSDGKIVQRFINLTAKQYEIILKL